MNSTDISFSSATSLNHSTLRQMAGSRSFERGTEYFLNGLVGPLAEEGGTITANVWGTREYRVQLRVEVDGVAYSCTCPMGAGGVFCKHCVALGLASIEQRSGEDRVAPQPQRPPTSKDAVRTYPTGADHDVLTGMRLEKSPKSNTARSRVSTQTRPRQPSWKARLERLAHVMEEHSHPPDTWPAGREILYVVDVPETITGHELVVEITGRQRKASGEWRTLKSLRIPRGQIETLPDPTDRRILALLAGARDAYDYYEWGYPGETPNRHWLSVPMQEALIPLMCRTGRCRLRVTPQSEELLTIQWDDGAPWELWLEVRSNVDAGQYALTGSLCRGPERMELSTPLMLLASGFVFTRDHCARLEDFGAFAWTSHLRRSPLTVPTARADELLKTLLRLPNLPPLVVPKELRYEEVTLVPKPQLKVRLAPRDWPRNSLCGELAFDYQGTVITADWPGRGIFQARPRRLILRDRATEQHAAERLRQLGFRWRSARYGNLQPAWELAPRRLPRVVPALLEDGWHVEAEGKLYRRANAFRAEVTSGIDWFELHGTVEFGDAVATLPAILAAVKRGETTVQLGDGTYGILPEEWLAKYGWLASLGTRQDDRLRFTRNQIGLLDALVASLPEATCDAVFAKARDQLRAFDGVKPAELPLGFVGELRGYQRDGLGWIQFLRQYGFGGCLADDMGLGKTVQALALLASRRGHGAGPSLVVVPKSLVFNWKQEAARFAPHLHVLEYTGPGRGRLGSHFRNSDLIITTYGTLRRDAVQFADLQFDYVILDESQVIKNAATKSAQAVRVLRSAHRLALSGTPVENHLGELWSLFEFLNPGMLGAARVFRLAGASGRNPSEETRAVLARALRPFILRRTKGQVVQELPPKVEQTLYCELEPSQRAIYDELKEHYRRALLSRIERAGINRAKILILEALLRLRQTACHVGLIDRSRRGEPSAKLDVLLPRLAEVLDKGYKALVFSQFTSLLAIVRDRLDHNHVLYEYLDGRTRDRAACVARFETDPDCRLFLVSLKAGGLGLNLTAAEYVFLLDPWWNPAVEAQAIDRTHRIGQTRPVFAYRLIARDTVEEKIMALQATKRTLAESIITADNSLIGALTREDLELLLA